MKAISIKQPWTYLIASGIKDVENRSWETSYRGRVYIHACGTKKKSIYSLTESQQEIVSDIPLIGTLLNDTQMMYSAIRGEAMAFHASSMTKHFLFFLRRIF